MRPSAPELHRAPAGFRVLAQDVLSTLLDRPNALFAAGNASFLGNGEFPLPEARRRQLSTACPPLTHRVASAFCGQGRSVPALAQQKVPRTFAAWRGKPCMKVGLPLKCCQRCLSDHSGSALVDCLDTTALRNSRASQERAPGV